MDIMAGLLERIGLDDERCGPAQGAQPVEQGSVAHAGLITLTTTIAAMNTHSSTSTAVART